MRVDPGCEVRLFEGSRFSGRSVQFRGDVSTLRSIGNDRVSSLRVRCHSDSWDDGYWDDGDWGGDGRRGVTLYRDLRLTGTSETFLDDDPDLRDNRVGNDQVTSVRVSRGCRAILYEHPGFRGRYTELSSDAFDLRGSTVGDDRISSLRVRCDGRPGGGYGGDPGWDRDRGVTLHRDLGFTGTSETFYGDVPSLSGSRIGNDQATSVSVPRGCFVRLYEHHNYQGDYTELNRDDPDLRGSRVGDDSVSSLRIECRRW
ncbi:MAG: beta/gamma crystallin-related protein [Acidobacteriota bacterium]